MNLDGFGVLWTLFGWVMFAMFCLGVCVEIGKRLWIMIIRAEREIRREKDLRGIDPSQFQDYPGVATSKVDSLPTPTVAGQSEF